MQDACSTLNSNVAKMHEALLALNSECLEEIASELQQAYAEPDSTTIKIQSEQVDDSSRATLQRLLNLREQVQQQNNASALRAQLLYDVPEQIAGQVTGTRDACTSETALA